MPFRVSGKNLDIGGALRERINARIVESLSKYFDGGYSGHVTVEKDGFGFRTECAIHLDSGITLHTEANAADAYVSADQAALRIEKRLRRYKRRLKDHHAARANGGAAELSGIDAASYVLEAPSHDGEDEVTEFNPVIIAESTTVLKQLSVSEAVMELDMTGAPVVVFRHASHGRVNLVYRRPDGNVGWIDPPAQGPLTRVGRPDKPPPSHNNPANDPTDRFMPLTDLVAPNAIVPALKVNGKKQAIQELSGRAAKLTGQNERLIFETLMQREKLGSTGVGNGIAIPARQAAEAREAGRPVRPARPPDRLRVARRPAGGPDLPAARARRGRRRSSEGAGARRAASARARNGRALARIARCRRALCGARDAALGSGVALCVRIDRALTRQSIS